MNEVSAPCGLSTWERDCLVPRNDAARRLIERLGSADPEQWPLVHVADRDRLRERLAHGGDCAFDLGSTDGDAGAGDPESTGTCLRLSVSVARESDGPAWVALCDLSPVERLRNEVVRLSGQRLIGSVMFGLVHDVNNLLTRFFGVADVIVPLARTDSEREFFRSIAPSIERDMAVLRRAGQLLGDGTREVRGVRGAETADVGAVARELVRMVARDAVARGDVSVWHLDCEVEPNLPAVAVPESVVSEVVLALLLFMRASGSSAEPGSLRVASSHNDEDRVELVFRDLGELAPARSLAATVGSGDLPGSGGDSAVESTSGADYEGVLIGLLGVGTAGGSFAMALEALDGGRPGPDDRAGRRMLCLELPALRRSESSR